VVLVTEERKKAEKRVEEVEHALAGYIAKDIMSSEAGIFERYIHRTDDSSNALGFLSSISTAFLDLINGKNVPYLVVLSSSPSSQSATSQTVVLVFGSDDKKVKTVGESIKSKIGVKGGGKGPRWSGKYTGVWKSSRIEESMKEIFNNSDRSG
jgi:misacylated tRNA(Ala) deacylase